MITTGGWQEFATMKEKRYYTAGIVYDKVLHIFGGYDPYTSGRLKTTEVVSENGITYDSPDLPDFLFLHAIASINATFSIITGGSSHAYRLNFVTGIYSSIN